MAASFFSSVSTALIWMDTYGKPRREQVISSEGGRMQQISSEGGKNAAAYCPQGKGKGQL